MADMILKLLCVFHLVYVTTAGGLDDFLPHSSSSGTQNQLKWNVTNAHLPHLPYIYGYMGTHGTYRYMTISEQTAWLIGEPKHGLWRYQDNGMIREYRRKGRIGLREIVDPNAWSSLTQAEKDIVLTNYAHHIPEESWAGYKYPSDKISKGDGAYDKQKDYMNFIDLSIYHPKYKGKYDSHGPIDLPVFYCTMSQPEYPHVWNAWKFAMKQPRANVIGPLGKRAGLDIKENNENVLQFHFIDDGGLWVQVGNKDHNGKDKKVTSPNNMWAQNVNYQRVDPDKMDIEVYLYERIFFNKPYLFILAIMDNKDRSSSSSFYSFVRDDGPYWAGLKKQNKASQVKNSAPNYYPLTYVKDYPTKGASSKQKMFGLPLYGTHHPNRTLHRMTGGACPEKGGDWAHYPWGDSAAGFPTNYEEITPICDAIVIDMKLATNLWVDTWKDPKVGLANSFYKKHVVNYYMDANVYGRYTDPYLVKKNAVNPHMMDLTSDGKIVYPGSPKKSKKKFTIPMNFTHIGKMIDYKAANDLKSKKKCAVTKCPTVKTVTCPLVQKCPTKDPSKDTEKEPYWGTTIIILVAVILVLVVVNLLSIFKICHMASGQNSGSSSPYVVDSKSNAAYSNSA